MGSASLNRPAAGSLNLPAESQRSIQYRRELIGLSEPFLFLPQRNQNTVAKSHHHASFVSR